MTRLDVDGRRTAAHATSNADEEPSMTLLAAPHVECEQHHPTLFVSDVLAAADYYVSKLGFSRGFSWGDPPTMVGVNLGGVSIHLAQGTPSPNGCSVYFVIGDADELYAFQRSNGAEILAPPEDRPYGLRATRSEIG